MQIIPRCSDDWFAKSKEQQGSWWPEWLKWLNKYSGELVQAPEFDKLSSPPIDGCARYLCINSGYGF